jgi:sec-independent protein translocase protein TatB
MLKKVGSWIGTAKRYIHDVQQEVSILENDEQDITVEKKNNDKE